MNHSFEQSQSFSRPFLNLLNPIGRNYQGYSHSLLEEDAEEPSTGTKKHISFQATQSRSGYSDDEDGDNIPPQSFLIESSPERNRRGPSSPQQPRKHRRSSDATPLLPVANLPPFSIPPRPSELDANQPEDPKSPATATIPPTQGLNAHERALWNWVNVYNLDAFLQEVYKYYTGKGIYCIVLAQGLNLLTVGFVITFSSFLLGCIDYSRIRKTGSTRLSEIVVDQCITKFSGLTFLCFGAFYLFRVISFAFEIRRLIDMYRFYTYLLGVPDADIQTISWPEIVRRIGAIRNDNPLTAISSAAQRDPDSYSPTAKLDAHDIANRIMREENYLIALFNKELLDLRLRLPAFVYQRFGMNVGESGKGRTLTRALEWNLRFCLLTYLFDHTGKVKKAVTKYKNRKRLIEQLRKRFIFMGLINAIFMPFMVLYLIMYSFFRYFEQYRNDPSSIGGRKYTAYASWKFREFNELPHLFKRRLDMSYPTATMYINQFPKEKTALVMRFVAFVAGSFAGVLLLASVVDPDLVLQFEITPHRTVLFYLGLFGTILAVARGMIPEENRVFDPELLMQEVVRHTHYMPPEWKGKLHSQMVHQEFGQLFDMKVSIFAQELFSVVITPFILWFSLPDCSAGIVDFFREFTVHVDGLGYVCSFAVFDFKRHGNVNFGAPTEQADERYQSRQGKMEKSFLNFKAAHPDWNPTDPNGSLYLSRLADFHNTINVSSKRLPVESFRRTFTSDRAQFYDRALQKSIAQRRPTASIATTMAQSTRFTEDDRAEDGGIDSTLGDSYVDDVRIRGGNMVVAEGASATKSRLDQDEADELASGGVLGLLAQIYDQRRQVL